MISVPNHPQLLNGNKIALCILLGTFLINASACKTTKSVDSISLINDPTSNSRILNEKLDTLPILSLEREGNLPIHSNEVSFLNPSDNHLMAKSKISQINKLNIGFVLPFLVGNNDFPQGVNLNNSVSRWAIQYYTGARLALENWKDKGLSFESFVWDSGYDTLSLKSKVLSDNQFLQIPLIIGPYHRDNIKLLAKYAKESGVLLFSPFSAAPNLTEANPFFYQVNPQIEAQINIIVDHALNNHRLEDILVLQKDSDTKLKELFLQAFSSKSANNANGLPHSILLQNNSSTWSKSLIPEMAKREKLAIIISTYTDEVFLNNLLQEINRETFSKKEITVYGLSPWLNMEKIDYQLLELLNFHVSTPFHLEDEQIGVAAFKSRFFQETGTLPQLEAFQGYDLINLLMEIWEQHPENFQESLENFKSSNFLSSPFQFKKIIVTQNGNEEWQLNMNQNISVLHFSGFKWRLD